MSCTWLLLCLRKCGSIRVHAGAECACSRGTHSSVTQEHRAGRKGISAAHCWGIHTALPILGNSISEHSTTPSEKCSIHWTKCSHDGQGCQAPGRTAATKMKRFPSEVINHPWCLGVNTQISEPCVSAEQQWDGQSNTAAALGLGAWGRIPPRPEWMWLTHNLMVEPLSSKPDGCPVSTKVQQIPVLSVLSLLHKQSHPPHFRYFQQNVSFLCDLREAQNWELNGTKQYSMKRRLFFPNKAVSAYVLLPCSNHIGQHLFKLPR